MFKTGVHGVLMAILWSWAPQPVVAFPLPADVPINPEAGRGGPLAVPVRLESGEELPFLVDTGTSSTFLDQSLEQKLGKPIDTASFQSWGHKSKANVYAAPKLYLGGVPLRLSSQGILTADCQHWGSIGGHPAMGMLGIDCLRNYCIQLDFGAGKIHFLNDAAPNEQTWGKAFSIIPLNAHDSRPAVAQNLFGQESPHSLIDSGFVSDGWLMPEYFDKWTNSAAAPVTGTARFPNGLFAGDNYPHVLLPRIDVESDGIGLRFLARHLVTLDFPKQTMYLLRQSTGPLSDPRLARLPGLVSLLPVVLREDLDAATKELAKIDPSNTTPFEKTVARKLVASLEKEPKPTPADVPPEVVQLPLGDARPQLAEVGWLQPAANRIPLSDQVESPLLDSGRVYATGLFAHSPSRYVFNLANKWKSLRGEAGLHTAFQGGAWGVVFVIKTDGNEVFRSPAIRGSEHSHYTLDLTGVRTLELRVENSGPRNGCNWALWLDPTLFR